MYVTTFYSFKGGVGRSMALANAAVELARRGRRVLVVDFDLEAPGLDTFDILRPREPLAGIIDFVREYLETDRAPDAARFLAPLPDIGDHGGRLWIMPSGAQQATYAAHFNQIDWAELYEKRDGYLLFEDLKAQWQQVVNPDYVLIDSRTGHTDTGGICTRQLPDAVVILFFPNEQNLRGLTKVVSDIRAETGEPRHKAIELHFVMSNVPDLDDEDRILEKKIRAFRHQLELTGDPLVVHRYDSLSLLNQVVFIQHRPKSRLAREYRAVADDIVTRNLDDRDGALSYIQRIGMPRRRRRAVYESQSDLEKRLRRIEEAHTDDGEVLFELGRLREDDPRAVPDAQLFDRAIESGYRQPEVYLQRARVRARSDDPAGASEDALRALQTDGLPPPSIWRAVSLIEPDESEAAVASPAVSSLDPRERITLADRLGGRRKQVPVAIRMLEPIVDDSTLAEEDRAFARDVLATRLIANGACGRAAELLRPDDRSLEDMDIRDTFNYGMALWGASGEIVEEPFDRVAELDKSQSEEEREGPNYWQCMAVANWAIDDIKVARQFETRARQAVRGWVFSCWRYFEVPANEFREDLDEIRALIDGDKTRIPRFMRSESTIDESN